MKRLVNHWDQQYYERGFAAQRSYPNEELLRFLGGNYFHLPRAQRKKISILELGCGSGANLWMIAREGFDAFGIDLSAEGIRLCSRMLKKWAVSAHLRVGSMLALPYDDACFDCVVDIVSSQHLTFADHVPLYRGIWRVLKPGGLFFSYHLGQKSFSFKHGGGKLIDRFTIDNIRNSKAPLNNNGITCFPSEGATETLLIKAGFGSVSIENVIKTYDERRIMLQYLVIRTKK